MDIIQSEKEDVTACGNITAPMVAETYMESWLCTLEQGTQISVGRLYKMTAA